MLEHIKEPALYSKKRSPVGHELNLVDPILGALNCWRKIDPGNIKEIHLSRNQMTFSVLS